MTETPHTEIETMLSTPKLETVSTDTTPVEVEPEAEVEVEDKASEIEMKAQILVETATEIVEGAQDIQKRVRTRKASSEDTETTAKKGKAKAKKTAKAKNLAKAKSAATATKKAAAKAKAEAKKAEPSTGQSGPKIEDLTAEDLNKNETKVMTLALKGDAPKTIVELSKVFMGGPVSKKKANSWTRNSLRRLVRGGFLAKVERGSYKVTRKGRSRMAAA